MISRRGLFKMLGAVAASPALALLPKQEYVKMWGSSGWSNIVTDSVSYNYRYTMSPRPEVTTRIIKIPTLQKAPKPEFVYWRESNV